MLDILKTLHQPDKIYSTGEVPILVTCEDFQTWVCKHGRLSTSHLFNELIASRFANIWEIRTPEICLINVSEEHLPIENANTLQPAFFRKPCFGSLYIESSKEIDSTLIPSFEDAIFRRKVKNKKDFLMIALFDIWLSNEDRNHNNSNLLLDFTNNEKYYFYVFDHNSIFNSNSLEHGLYQISENKSIINTDLAKILFKPGRNLTETVDRLIEKFYLCVKECEKNLKAILIEVPNEWNLNINQLELFLQQNLFTESWIEACENNFRTLIQTYI